ncbi:MAG: hypothetical protein H0W70_09990, partial [Actinobacteria bacterium]|nr:hypothetical protein [Actinomycetota bacterium]
MRTRYGSALLAAGLCLVVAGPAHAQSAEPESQLGGYVAGAAGWAVSFQPVLPALLPTGDAPVEATLSLSTANVKSGGNSLGRGAIFWPGSAAANLGPLLGTGASQPFVGGMVPPYPAFVEASAKDGEVARSIGPVGGMRAFGSPTRAEGDVRAPDVNVPGFVKIDSVSSNSAAEVTDIDVTSGCTVHLDGVSLLDGAISFKSIFSRSATTSTGTTSKAEGDLQVAGLKVTGVAAELTADGIHAVGLPPEAAPVPGATGPFPNANPDAALSQALSSLGVTIRMTRSVEKVSGGSADRLANGVVVSIKNPAVQGGRFDIVLASTGSTALATPLADLGAEGLDLSSSGSDLTGALSSAAGDTGGGGGSAGDFSASPLG